MDRRGFRLGGGTESAAIDSKMARASPLSCSFSAEYAARTRVSKCFMLGPNQRSLAGLAL